MLIDHLDAQNRAIIDEAMLMHDQHYRALCLWIAREMKKKPSRRRWFTGPSALGEILCHGHTVCCCIWEKYTGESS